MSEQEEMLNNENHSFGLTDPFDDNFEETFQGKKSENVGCSARISSNSSLCEKIQIENVDSEDFRKHAFGPEVDVQ